MIRVAIETATAVGSVAVGRGDRVLAEVVVGVQARHAEKTLPALEMALELAGVARPDIGEVVVGAGPGSFTGVRVAGATAKGLVAALDVPLVAYSSLLALAVGAPAEPGRPVCALLDARRGEVYAGCWRVVVDGVGTAIQTVIEPMVGPIEAVIRATAAAAPLFAGDGALRYREALDAAGAASPAAGPESHPRAASLLWLAEHHGAMGRIEDASGWEPAYVRASSAERGVPG